MAIILIAVFLFGSLQAQDSREIFLYEDFGSGTFPPANWTISSNATNWSLYAGANAGGAAPELRLSWTPQFNGTSYFISPMIDTSGETSLYLDFRHFLDFYDTPFTLGVATRAASGDWHTVWTISPTDDVGPLLQTVNINNTDVGSTEFQFAFYFSGSSYNIDYWYIDNIKLYTPFPYDLAVTATDLPEHVEAGTVVTPSCTVKNVGLNALTATVSLDIYQGDVLLASHPDYYSAFLNSYQTETAAFPAFTVPGSNELYKFIFTITSLEDVVDDDPSNNTLEAFVNTWTGSKQMVILEIGTGAWCQYCPGAAMAADDFVDGGYNVAVIENHNGDPYANDTSNARNSYYGISGYPTGFFDGVLSYVGGNHTTSVFPAYLPLYEQRNLVKTPINLNIYGEETRENYDITVRIHKLAPLAYPNTVLHLALTESDITYSWQGQNHLNFVDRMMYPSWEGTPVDLVAAPLGTTDITLSISKDASWVTTSCELVAFVQNVDTKEIIQGNKIMIYDLVAPPVANDDDANTPALTTVENISPNPFSTTASITYSLKDNGQTTVGIYNIKGQLVKELVSEAKTAGNHTVAWDGLDRNGRNVANGAYLVRLQCGKDISTRKLMLVR
jgi:hypothetical protein